MEIGEGQPQGCPFFGGDGSDEFGESTLPVCLQSQTPGISQAVPLSLRKNAKGDDRSDQNHAFQIPDALIFIYHSVSPSVAVR